MHLIRLPQNRGITTALNTGLQWIVENTTAPYIARLDCRDTCDPEAVLQTGNFFKHPCSSRAAGLLVLFQRRRKPV
jgi:glycosyltransferase involved in cell wall biosynthesis